MFGFKKKELTPAQRKKRDEKIANEIVDLFLGTPKSPSRKKISEMTGKELRKEQNRRSQERYKKKWGSKY